MAANMGTATNSEKVVTLAPPPAKTTGGQGGLKAEDKSLPRSPTPFQEIPESLHEESVQDDAGTPVTPPPDAANPTKGSGELLCILFNEQEMVIECVSQGTTPCEEGKHEYKTKHGVMGILMAIVR